MRWQRIYRVANWRAVLPALLACCGAILGVITIILSASNRVSPQQAIALALPTIVITIGGLVASLVPDAWTAWRRGFKQGCRVGLILQREGLYSGSTPTPKTQTQRQRQLSRRRLPPAAM